MKKHLTLIDLAAFTFGMVSCGSNETTGEEKEGESKNQPDNTTIGHVVLNGSFNL